MNYKIVLAFFLISAALTKDTALAQTGNELRCQCINTHSKFIHPKLIQNVKLIQSGPHCQNVEVIATLNNDKEICLEPTAPWVKLIIKAILSKAEADNEISL